MAQVQFGTRIEAVDSSTDNSVNNLPAQGFTMNTNTGKFFSARNKGIGADMKTIMTRFPASGKIGQTSSARKLGHANDCAFYSGKIFVAMGDDSINKTETDIACFDTNLNYMGKYKYKQINNTNDTSDNTLLRISAITYVKWNWFLVGYGKKFASAYLEEKKSGDYLGVMHGFCRLNLPDIDDKIKRDGCGDPISQGVFYSDSNDTFYKAFSHKNALTDRIVANDIVSYGLPGQAPSFSHQGKAKYYKRYKCDKDNLDFFELEALSSPDNGESMYISTTAKTSGSDQKRNYVYHVYLN